MQIQSISNDPMEEVTKERGISQILPWSKCNGLSKTLRLLRSATDVLLKIRLHLFGFATYLNGALFGIIKPSRK